MEFELQNTTHLQEQIIEKHTSDEQITVSNEEQKSSPINTNANLNEKNRDHMVSISQNNINISSNDNYNNVNTNNSSKKDNNQANSFENTKTFRLISKFDIFKFIPHPKTKPKSTRFSIIGSVSLLFIFFVYVVYSFVMFCIKNYPTTSQYASKLGTENLVPPRFAIGFFYGDSLNQTFYDTNYFTITMQQVTKYTEYSDSIKSISIDPDYCGDLEWVGYPFNNKEDYPYIFCPYEQFYENETLSMQGLLYSSPEQHFPRFTFKYCSSSSGCQTGDNLMKITGGGRIFLFIKQEASTNYATGKTDENKQRFQIQQFFLVPGLYNRAEIVMQLNKITIHPDYLTSFKTRELTSLVFKNVNFYESNVTYYNKYSAFQIWMRLDEQITNIDIVYPTIVDMISKWGAFWGVLFSLFAVFFLAFNENKFYKENPQWEKFETENFIQKQQPTEKLEQIKEVKLNL